jgi:hypothetical protein
MDQSILMKVGVKTSCLLLLQYYLRSGFHFQRFRPRSKLDIEAFVSQTGLISIKFPARQQIVIIVFVDRW